MQVITKLIPHDTYSLAISWEPGEDPIYKKLMSEANQCVLHIENKQELIADFCFEHRRITSKLLKNYAGAEIVISNCCPTTKRKE